MYALGFTGNLSRLRLFLGPGGHQFVGQGYENGGHVTNKQELTPKQSKIKRKVIE